MDIYLPLEYCITVRRNYETDWIPWNVKLTGSVAVIYQKALENHQNLYDIPELTEIMEQAREAIRAEETDQMLADEDPYVMECLGKNVADPDELNGLVRAHDPHTLTILGLDDWDDEALDNFDAESDLDEDEIPLVCDLDPDFIPEDPFEGQYELSVRFAESKPKHEEKPKQWKATVVISTGEAKYFPDVSFRIPDEYYDEIQSAVAAGKSVYSCACRRQLEELAQKALDVKDYIDPDSFEMPDRDDYDNDEDYESDLEDYNDRIQSAMDDITIWDVKLDDPNAENNFEQSMIGRTFPNLAYIPQNEDEEECRGESLDLEDSDDFCNYHYLVNVAYDPTGTITFVEVETSEAMEWSGERTDSWTEVEPDFDFIESAIEEWAAEAGNEE